MPMQSMLSETQATATHPVTPDVGAGPGIDRSEDRGEYRGACPAHADPREADADHEVDPLRDGLAAPARKPVGDRARRQ